MSSLAAMTNAGACCLILEQQRPHDDMDSSGDSTMDQRMN